MKFNYTQTWRVMRTILFLLTAALLQVHATSNAQISLHEHNTTLRQAIKSIAQQTGYDFVYADKDLRLAGPIRVALSDATLEQALAACFDGQPLTYAIEDNTVLVRRKPTDALAGGRTQAVILNEREGSLLIFAFPESKGRVVDSTGNPLAGASVRVLNAEGKRTSLQTQTDRNGEFVLHNVPEDALLEITYIGYITQTIGARPNVGQIALQAIPSTLEEVTVSTGYWQTTRRLSTGNIAKVSAEEIARQPVGNPLSTLEGKVPGLVITQTTGLPGGAIKVELRGRTAIDRNITDDQPLFIIDDIPFGSNNGWLSTLGSALGQPSSSFILSSQGGTSPFNTLNPADIESIEVLKDADATAIYGSRGANGVIRITTKKGVAGKTTVDFNAYTGTSNLARPVEMMDTRQYVAIREKAFANSGAAMTPSNAYDLLVWDTTRYTDFTNLLAGNTAYTTNAQLSLSGGNNQTQFLISGNVRKETTVVPGDFADRRNGVNVNFSHQSVDRKFKLTFAGIYNLGKNSIMTIDPLRDVLGMMPHTLLYHPDGSLAWNEGGYYGANPLAYTKSGYAAVSNLAQGNLLLSYLLMPGLSIKTNLGYSSNQLNEQNSWPSVASNPTSTINRYTNVHTNRFQSYVVEPQLDYQLKRSYGDVALSIGATWQQVNNGGTQIRAEGFSSDELLSSLNAALDYTAQNHQSDYRYAAAFGRIGYDWQGKYLLNLSGRRDGSSRFGDGAQFANFGAIGAAWIFSKEPWVEENLTFLSFGKLRASYGITGNDKIQNYQYLDTWAVTTTPYDGMAGLYPNKLYNPEYRWEKTTKWEGELETALFNDRVSISLAYFRHQSSNQLTNYRLPYTAGFPTVVANLPATVRNSGWELAMNSTNVKTPTFRWTTVITATIPKNELVSFPNLALSTYASSLMEGQSLNLIRGYRYLGVDTDTGIYTFEDLDGNDQYNASDYAPLGDMDPKLFGGIQNTFRYRQFELNVFFSFRKQTGRNYLASLGSTPPGFIRHVLPAKMRGFWETPGDDAKLQRLTNITGAEYTALTRFVSSSGIYSDASFARLRNLELAYRIPNPWLNKLRLQQARVYLQGQNLFTFTKYEIGDPETQFLNRIPPLRVVTFGLHLTL